MERRSVLQAWLGRPEDEPRAWFLLGANLFALPGLGTLLAGRRVAGAAQALLSTAGAVACFVWLRAFFRRWAAEGAFPLGPGPDLPWALWGLGLFGAAWLWSLGSGLSVLRETRLRAASSPSGSSGSGSPPRGATPASR